MVVSELSYDSTNLELDQSWIQSARHRGIRGLWNRVKRAAYATPLYPLTLWGAPPDRILGTPPALWIGDPEIGHELLDGVFQFAGCRLRIEPLSALPRDLDETQARHLFEFEWLSDLRALGNEPAKQAARDYILGWITVHSRWSPFAWRADILGNRLVNWLTHYGFFGADADDEFRCVFFASIGRQTKHLSRTLADDVWGIDRVTSLKGLVYAGIALPGKDRLLETGLASLAEELSNLILPDGGYVGRNPAQQFILLRHLVEIRESLVVAHLKCPDWLTESIKLMVPLLRMFRYADGSLALFNGGTEEPAEWIDALLSKAGVRARATTSAPHSGFHRISAGRTVVLLEAGRPPRKRFNRWAHAGTLAFEMCVGKDRMIVNCGADTYGNAEWRKVLRSTAAHTNVTVDDVSSSECNEIGGFFATPGNVTAGRRESGGSVIIEASHDGYEARYGLTHRRLLMIGPDGDDVQGEDNLIGGGGKAYALRFHLHPTVQATMLQGQNSAILRLRRGGGWRFACDDGTLSVDESVYCGRPGQMKRSLQVVVSGSLGGAGATVKWRLTRV